MNIAIIISLCLTLLLSLVSYLASEFYIWDAKHHWNKAPLSDRRGLDAFADPKILMVSRLTLAGAVASSLVFIVLLVWRAIQ
jgi:hypothetical protein